MQDRVEFDVHKSLAANSSYSSLGEGEWLHSRQWSCSGLSTGLLETSEHSLEANTAHFRRGPMASTHVTQDRTRHPGFPAVQLRLICDQICTGSESFHIKYGAKEKKRNGNHGEMSTYAIIGKQPALDFGHKLCIVAYTIAKSWIRKVKFSLSQMFIVTNVFWQEIFTKFDSIAAQP